MIQILRCKFCGNHRADFSTRGQCAPHRIGWRAQVYSNVELTQHCRKSFAQLTGNVINQESRSAPAYVHAADVRAEWNDQKCLPLTTLLGPVAPSSVLSRPDFNVLRLQLERAYFGKAVWIAIAYHTPSRRPACDIAARPEFRTPPALSILPRAAQRRCGSLRAVLVEIVSH